ncbi:hypothetical protein CCR75_003745 [Bremia lactucae]|uniref:RxLR effector protein n=1 Tax=Bremia lactucae TaxID=4779 RepID=A0A976FKH4_BRELC|nr:hypothetical protein CCR75_003745 [Bremia lactucae]
MRFAFVVFVTAAAICASLETISAQKDAEHDTFLAATTTTRSLKEDNGAVSNSRPLRFGVVGSNQSESMPDGVDLGEDSYMDTVYFKLWRLHDKLPGEVYNDLFGTMDPASAAQNPGYGRYLRYVRYCEKH